MSIADDQRRPNPPEKAEKPARGSLSFSLLSVAVSILFLIYAFFLFSRTDGDPKLLAFVLLTAAYGVCGLLVVTCAYKFRARWCVTVIQVGAVAYLLLYVLAFSAGIQTVFGLSGILLLGLGLWCNWYAVTLVIRR